MIPLNESLCPIEETGIWREFSSGSFPEKRGLYIVRMTDGNEKKIYYTGGKPNSKRYPRNVEVTHWLESEAPIRIERRRTT